MEVNKAEEPVTAYPARVGSSSANQLLPPMAYTYQSPAGYPYAPAAGYGNPPLPHYGAHLQQPLPPARVGSSSANQLLPPMAYTYQSPAGYPYAPAAGYGYPPLPYYGAHLQQPPPPVHGYPLPQQCYEYLPVQPPQQPKKKERLELGWLAGLCGKVVSNVLAHAISDDFNGSGGCVDGGGGS